MNCIPSAVEYVAIFRSSLSRPSNTIASHKSGTMMQRACGESDAYPSAQSRTHFTLESALFLCFVKAGVDAQACWMRVASSVFMVLGVLFRDGTNIGLTYTVKASAGAIIFYHP